MICWKGSPGFRKIVILTVMDSYSERIQIKTSEGKGHMRQSPAANFQVSFPSRSHGCVLNALGNSVRTCVKCGQPGKLSQALVSRVNWGQSQKSAAPDDRPQLFRL